MTDVVEFESWDELQNIIRDKENSANNSLLPVQKEVGWGDNWVTFYNDYGDNGLLVFGHVMDEEEFIKSEKSAGATEAELETELRTIKSSYDRGYRFGWAYSIIVPEGELGSTHLSSMVGKITEEQFNQAKESGWFFELPPRWLVDVVIRGVREARDHDVDTASTV